MTERVGGRCWTARGFADGQTAEHGGEFIDTAHHRIRGSPPSWVSPSTTSRRQAAGTADCTAASTSTARYAATPTCTRTPSACQRPGPRPTAQRIGSWRWDRAGRAARELDEMTAPEWLDRALPSRSDRLLRLATAQYISRGVRARRSTRLSAITMVGEFGPVGGPSDERFHVHGGNDQIAAWLVAGLLPAGTVQLGHPLRALTAATTPRTGSRSTGRPGEVAADVVVLCLPFTALRRVDLDGAGLSARKRRCIDELGMGTNAKVLIQFKDHLSHYDRFNGAYSDEHIDTWNSAVWRARPRRAAHRVLGRPSRCRLPRRPRRTARPRQRCEPHDRSDFTRRAGARRADTTATPGSTTGRATLGRTARTPRSCPASSPATRASSAAPKAGCTSGASTPPWRHRATSKARCEAASAAPARRPHSSADDRSAGRQDAEPLRRAHPLTVVAPLTNQR